jgi:hypothetical protein
MVAKREDAVGTKIGGRSSCSETEQVSMQEYLRREFNAYLAPYVRMNYFLKQTSEVPYGDCLSISLTAKMHSMNLKLRQKVMSLKSSIGT